MVKQENYNIVSEAIVEDLLKKHYKKTPEKISGTGNKNFGDFKIGNKIIEVKGLWTDEQGYEDDKFDFVSSAFSLSIKEWNFIKKYPRNFEMWVVYRLDEKYNGPEYPVKYAIIKGTVLKTCVPKYRSIKLAIHKQKWKNTEQYKVPKHILQKHKNKKVSKAR